MFEQKGSRDSKTCVPKLELGNESNEKRKRLTLAHGLILLCLVVVFGVINFLIIQKHSDTGRAFLVAFGTPLGPFTGALARDWQSCCTEFSAHLLPYSLALLLPAIAIQWIGTPERHVGLRLVGWALGWLAWFFSGLVSFGHALS